MTVSSHRRLAIAGVLASGLLIAATACSSSSGSNSGSSSPSGASSPSSTGSVSTASGTVHTVSDAKLGTIMVNGKGFTLYRFDADSAKPSASHCTGACAVIWSAVPATGANNVQGVDHQLVGSVNRPGSSAKQLTIAGWPMYTYSQDSKPGQTNGQGVDGTWFAVAPTGAKAASSGSGTMPGSGTSGGGYGY